ncbi:MAG: hypothetical protein QMD22_07665 [archaeon]|nr:hypothetical protein [archaeon]
MAVLTGVESTFLAGKKVGPEKEEVPRVPKIETPKAVIKEEKKPEPVAEPVKKPEPVAEAAKVEEKKKRPLWR